MEVLRTFTFAKSFYWYFDKEWRLIDRITSARVMPILQLMNFASVINSDDLDRMRHSALFNDHRNVAVHYAFIINDGGSHMKLSECVPCGSQTHPRPIGSATFACECLPNNQLFQTSDSLDSLNSGSFSSNIRFVQITLLYDCLPFAKGDWTALHCLSILLQLHSLHVLLYDMRIPPDDTSLQIITDITPMIFNFAFCFRRRYNHNGFGVDLIYAEHSLFIEKLRQRILAFEQRKEAYVIVDEDGCGLIMWF
ncbi:unnamed protein product [Rotaria sp. Silwood2]|nr:unnamed protein product [Rotaria sp. Silwood2]